jgi:hypothetical protein
LGVFFLCDNDIATITEALCIYQSELSACVVESTYNWYWLVDGLMAAGFVVRLAHTSALPLVQMMAGIRVALCHLTGDG